MKEPKIAIETIQPCDVDSLLNGMSTNRPVSQSKVKSYSDQMAEGLWVWNNGTSICFGENGPCVDGQHRLLACKKSGVPLKTITVRGVDPNAFETIDTGKKRSGGDTLACEGYRNWNNLAAAARWVRCYENATPFGKAPVVTNHELRETVKDHPGLCSAVGEVLAYRKDLLVSSSVLAGFYYLFSRSDKSKAQEFLRKFATGENLDDGSPILALRKFLIKQSMTNGSSPFIGYAGRQFIADALIRSWNAHVKGAQLKAIRATTDLKFHKIG